LDRGDDHRKNGEERRHDEAKNDIGIKNYIFKKWQTFITRKQRFSGKFTFSGL
jgi:hypothetical protein